MKHNIAIFFRKALYRLNEKMHLFKCQKESFLEKYKITVEWTTQ